MNETFIDHTAAPMRRVGEFDSTGKLTGIVVDLEVQFGPNEKDEKILNDFIERFEKIKAKQQAKLELEAELEMAESD